MSLLDYYSSFSGLKVNYTKSKAIWIGSKKYSKDVYHHSRWKLEWGAKEFSLLGINFTINLNQITETNYDSKIKHIQNLLKIWSLRKLTVLGRVTVVKTLIIPIITYLLISLPNPSNTIITNLNKMFFKFIWQNKPEKIKRELLTQDYRYGGIKMPNIQHVMMSLKSSWIKRLLLNNKKWVNLFQSISGLTTHNLIIYGDYFITLKKENIKNSFWKDVLYSWVLLQQKQILTSTEDIQGLNIWYNSKILKDNKPFSYNNYIRKGIIFINDLLDDEGNFLTFQIFREKYDIKTNFLNYASLVKAVKAFLNSLDNINNKTFITLQTPILPFKIKIFLNKSVGNKAIYNLLNNKKIIPKAEIKYANEGFHFDSHMWEIFYILPFKCVKDTTLIWFQYRLLHRILATNSFLYMIHYVDSNKCSFCNNAPETLQHIFYDCSKVRNLWGELEKWIFNKTGIHLSFNKNNVMFGMINNKISKIVNWLIINIKYYIYNTKIFKNSLNIKNIEDVLQHKFQIEKYIYLKNCEYDKFNENWAEWLNLFA